MQILIAKLFNFEKERNVNKKSHKNQKKIYTVIKLQINKKYIEISIEINIEISINIKKKKNMYTHRLIQKQANKNKNKK